MSKTIDERVVEMRFDNKHFEDNVQTTMSTLDKFKEKLNFKGATKGLEDIDQAAKKVDINPLATAAEAVSVKFSALQVMAVTALQNITNSAIDAGKKIVSALTIDPIKTGFSEYETQINAVQTILANTQSKGTTLDDINKALDELNTYADKTIYNFTEMTRNIGTFTAAGVDLKTSVAAIKGIANLAAVSGSTSQQASTAMYQLSQALASGTVKLMDWNSVVNAGMGGQVFQDALKETARLHGIAIDQMIEDEGSFRETLSSGWLSSEILTETLAKFTGDLTEAQLKSMGYTDEQTKSILKMGETANDAATKVKTFTQLFDTLKEAAQSGWSQTWEIVVGDFEEAKKLFTEVSDAFGKIIGDAAQSRNELLEGALSSKWDDLGEKITKAGGSFEDFQKKLIETAKSHGIEIDKMIEKEGSLEATLESGWLTSDIVAEALRSYSDGILGASAATTEITEKLAQFQDVVDKVINGDFGNGEERVKALTEAGYDYATVQELVNYVLADGTIDMANLSEEQLKNLGLTNEQAEAIRALAAEAEKAGTPLNELIADLEKPSGRELLIDTFRNALTALGQVLGAVREAWLNAFPPMTSEQLYNIIERIHAFSEGLIMTEGSIDKLKRTFDGLFAIVDLFTTLTGGAFKIALKIICKVFDIADMNILDMTAAVGDAIVAFRDWLLENNAFVKGLEKVIDVVAEAIKKAVAWFKEFRALPETQKKIENFKTVFAKALTIFKDLLDKGGSAIWKFGKKLVDGVKKIKSWIDEFKAIPLVQESIDKFKNGVTEAVSGIGGAFGGIGTDIKTFFNNIGSMDTITFDGILSAFGTLRGKIAERFSDMGGSFDGIKEALAGFAEAIVEKFGGSWESISGFWTNVKGFFASFKEGFGGIGTDIKTFFNNIGSMDTITFEGILSALGELKTNIAERFSEMGGSFEGIKTRFTNFGDELKTFFSNLREDIKSNFGAAGESIDNFATKIIDFFKNIKERIGSVDLGGILVAALGIGSLTVGGKIADALEAFGTPFIGFNDLIEELTGALKDYRGVLKAQKFKIIAIAIAAMAVAILVLVGALALLTLLPQDKLWSSVGAMAVLAGIVVGMAAAMKMLNTGLKTGMANATALLALAGAVLILVIALKMMDSLDSDKLLGNVVALGSVMSGLFGVSVLLSKIAPKLFTGSISIIAFALATKLLVSALVSISAIEEGLGRSILVLESIMGGLALAMAACKNIKIGGALAALSIVIALKLLINMLDDIAKIDLDMISDNIGAFIAIFAMLEGLLVSTNLAGTNAGKAAAAMLAVSIALLLITSTIRQLATIDPDSLSAPLGVVSALMTVMTGVIASTKLAGGNAVKAGAMLLMMAGALAIVAIVAAMLAKIDPDGLWRGVGAIAALEAMFMGLIVVTKFAGTAKTVKSVLITLTVALVLLGVILAILATMDPENVLAAAGGLTMVMSAMAAMLTVVSSIKANAKTLGIITAMTAIVAALGGILYLLADLPVESTLAIAASLSVLLLSLSGACAILTVAGNAAGAALKGVLIMAAVIVAVGALMAGIGALLEYVPDLEVWIDKAIPILEKIGYGLGSFAGSIIGGFSAGALSGLPAIADTLSDFMTRIQPFFDGVKAIDSELVASVANIVKIVLMMTAANLIDSIAGFITGGQDNADFARQLVYLGQGIADFSDVVKGKVDAKSVETAANAGKLLTELANTVPNTGGVLGFLAGNNDVDDFGNRLKPLAQGLVDFSGIVAGKVDAAAVETAALAGEMLTSLADTVPNTGGVLGFLAGNNDVDDFGNRLKPLAQGLVDFSSIVAGKVDTEAVETAVLAGELLTSLADTVPNTGGLLGFLAGNNDVDDFGNRLSALAWGIVNFSQIVSGGSNGSYKIDAAAVETAASAGKLLTELANTVPNSRGMVSWFAGNNDIDVFGGKLAALGQGIVDFSDVVKDNVDDRAVSTAASCGELLVTLANNISETKIGGFLGFLNKGMSVFSNEIIDLAKGLVGFSYWVGGHGGFPAVDGTAVTTAANAGSMLADLSDKISETKTGGFWGFLNKGMANFAEQIVPLGKGIVAFSDAVAGKVDNKAVASAASAGDLIASLSSKVSESTGSWLSNLFGGDKKKFENFKDQMPLLGEAIVKFSDAIAGKISTTAVTSAETVSEVLKVLTEHMNTDMSKISTFSAKLSELGDSLLGFYNDMVEIKPGLLNNSMSSINTAVGITIPKWLETVDTDKMTSFGRALKTLGTKIEDYHDDVTGMDLKKLEAALDVLDYMIALANDMEDIDTSSMDEFGNSLHNLGVTGVDKFIAAFTDADVRVQEAAKKMTTTFGNTALGQVTSLTNAFGVLFDDLLVNIVTNECERFGDVAERLLLGFAEGITNGTSTVETRATNLISAMKVVINNKYSEFEGMGKYMIDGFAAGIKSKSREAVNEAAALARAAAQAIKDELDINSPSKVLYKLGGFSGMGFVNALHDYSDKSYDAGSDMAESAKMGLSKAISKVLDLLNGDINMEPVIRPVLDLTNVEYGARRLNTMFARMQAMSIEVGSRYDSSEDQNGVPNGRSGNTYQFTQNNYSPKSLSRIDIYRQTKNQFSAMERMVEAND